MSDRRGGAEVEEQGGVVFGLVLVPSTSWDEKSHGHPGSAQVFPMV